MTPDQAEEKVRAYFYQGYNCAQSVLQVLQEAWQLSGGVDPRPALGFGGGVGGGGDACGALSGGVMAISLLVGDHSKGDVEADKAKARKLGQEYRASFKEKFGTVGCSELTGFDYSTAEGRAQALAANTKDKTCVHLVVFAVRTLLPLAEREYGRA